MNQSVAVKPNFYAEDSQLLASTTHSCLLQDGALCVCCLRLVHLSPSWFVSLTVRCITFVLVARVYESWRWSAGRNLGTSDPWSRSKQVLHAYIYGMFLSVHFFMPFVLGHLMGSVVAEFFCWGKRGNIGKQYTLGFWLFIAWGRFSHCCLRVCRIASTI